MSTSIDDLRLHIRIDEGTGPVIVMLHGINSNADDLRPVINELGHGHRIVAPDLLGFGLSPKPADIEYSLDEHAQVLEATLRDLGIVDPFLLFGYSLGGSIATRYASTYPQRLRRLFLLSAPFYLPPETYSKRGFGLEYAQAMLFTWLWKVIGRQKERDTPIYKLAAGRLRSVAEDFLRAGDISEHWDVMARTLENTISKSTFIDDLPKLTMPTVFALGMRDAIVRPDQTPALKRLKPDLEIRRIMGLTADHVLINSTPERVAAEVLRDEVKDLSVAIHLGSGAPLVLLPNLDEKASSWRPVAAALRTNHEVVALDLLGFGGSPSPLSSHYSLADHVAAILGTINGLFAEREVTLVGRGFGGTLALACAAANPRMFSRVVALAPLLPDVTAAQGDPALSAMKASRDTLVASARDERMQRIASEALERQVLPTVRSMNGLLAIPTAEVIARVKTDALIVLPDNSPMPTTPLGGPSCSTEFVPGVRNPAEHDAIVVAAIRGEALPDASEIDVVAAAPRARDPLTRQLGGLNTRLLTRGTLLMVVGLPLLLLPAALPPDLITLILAAWLGVEAAQTLIGSIGLKRRRRPWLLGFIIGSVELLFALAILLGALFALQLVALVIIVGGFIRGATILIVAWKAPRTPGRRWLLVADGVLSLAIAAALIAYPPLGSRLLRWTIGGYLTASGASSLALALANQTAARRRLREYLAVPG